MCKSGKVSSTDIDVFKEKMVLQFFIAMFQTIRPPLTREAVTMSSTDIDVIKEIPGYKVILKAVVKSQIQLLVCIRTDWRWRGDVEGGGIWKENNTPKKELLLFYLPCSGKLSSCWLLHNIAFSSSLVQWNWNLTSNPCDKEVCCLQRKYVSCQYVQVVSWMGWSCWYCPLSVSMV